MKLSPKFGFALTSLSIAAAMLACSLFTGAPTPTVAPESPTPESTPTELPTIASPQPTIDEAAPTEKNTVDPNAPVPAGELGVFNINVYQDEYDYWYFNALVMNNTDRTVDSIEIEVAAVGATGDILYSETTYPSLYSLTPGEVSPISTWFWDENFTADTQFTAEIVGYSSTEIERSALTFQGTTMSEGGGYLNITGEVLNSSGQPLNINGLAAATFDATGNMIMAGSASADIGYLDPDQTAPFRISLTSPKEGTAVVSDYVLYSDASISETSENYALAFLGKRDYIDTDGFYHLVGEIQNNSSVKLNIRLIAGIYDANDVVLDADTVDLPIYALAPGETISYNFQNWTALNNVSDLAQNSARYTVQWDPGWTWDTQYTYIDLPYSDAGYEYDDFWGLVFKGKVSNNSGGSVSSATIVINIRDAAGNLLFTDDAGVYEEIPDGGSADYEVTIPIELNFDTTNLIYEIIAKGELP